MKHLTPVLILCLLTSSVFLSCQSKRPTSPPPARTHHYYYYPHTEVYETTDGTHFYWLKAGQWHTGPKPSPDIWEETLMAPDDRVEVILEHDHPQYDHDRIRDKYPSRKYVP